MIAGILIAAIIGASIPLYTSAIGQIGLQQTLANAERSVAHIALRTGISKVSRESADDLDSATQRITDEVVGEWIEQTVRWEETLTLPPERVGELIPGTRVRLGHYDKWQSQVLMEDGVYPGAAAAVGADVEAVASLDLAQALQLQVGDLLTLRDGRDSSTPVVVRITGLFKASDPASPYWPADSPPIGLAEPAAQWEVQGTLLIHGDAFYPLVTANLPETTINLGWRLLMDHPSITLEQIPQLRERLAGLSEALQETDATYYDIETGLSPLLETYAAEAQLLGAPFGLLIIQMVALTLYFLLMTAELIRHYDRREISLMRSRGGGERQVWTLRGLEALIICLAMVGIAPWVARAGLMQISSLGSLRSLELGALPLGITPAVYGYAAGAGFVSMIALMLTLRPVMRASLVTAGGVWERPEKRAWWQRYYIDMGLLVVGGVAYWQLSSYGSVLIQQFRGDLVIDPLLLMTPSLLMIAVGALSLRLFNPIMNLVSYLLVGRDGLTSQLAGWQISRRPVHHSRIALMLALAVGMGWFATSFNSTVVRSQKDRSEYAAGTDLRISEIDTLLGQSRMHPSSTYAELEGVERASLAFRSRINASTQSGATVFGEILGVDPETFGGTAAWRQDLGVLLVPGAGSRQLELPGRIMAPTPYRLGLWLRMPGEYPFTLEHRLRVSARILDDDGTMVNIPLRFSVIQEEFLAKIPDLPDAPNPIFAETGWVYAEADFTQSSRPLVAPFRLQSIHWTYRSPNQFGGSFRLHLADLTVYDRDQTPFRLDWLDNLVGWRYLDDGISPSEGSVNLAGNSPSEGSGVSASWFQEGRTSSMGIALESNPPGSLPAIVSTSFLRANGLSGEEPFQLNVLGSRVLFRVVAIMDHYPSLYADQRPFIVTDVNLLVSALNYKPSATFYPNEAWLKLDDPSEGADLVQIIEDGTQDYAVRTSALATELERRMQADPLTIGLSGLFFIAFGVALVLSALSLLSYIALTAQARRVEFSVLQALGMPPRRLLIMLSLEQALVFGSGVLVGAALGALLGRQILPFLSVTKMGQVITPPYIVEVDVVHLLRYALSMIGVLAILLVGSLWLLRRLPLARTLRLGDE